MNYQAGGIPQLPKDYRDDYTPEMDLKVERVVARAEDPQAIKDSPLWNLASPAMRSYLSRVYHLR